MYLFRFQMIQPKRMEAIVRQLCMALEDIGWKQQAVHVSIWYLYLVWHLYTEAPAQLMVPRY